MANRTIGMTSSLNTSGIHDSNFASDQPTMGDTAVTTGEIAKPQDNLFDSVPDELLLSIFDALSTDANKSLRRHEVNRLIRRLSLVCKRFRRAVIDTTSFWTKIDHPYCRKGGFETRLSRTKGAPLSIDMTGIEDMVPVEREEGLNRMMNLGSRWQCLRARFGHMGWEDVLEGFSGREFPGLETAHLHFSPFGFAEAFFDEWKFPNLVSLRTHNAIPPLTMYRGLSELNISVNRTWLYEEQHHEKLLESLKCVPRLERLSLHLAGNLTQTSAPVPVPLPSLVFLSISNYYDPTASSQREGSALHVAHFLESLQMPKVQDLRVALVFPDESRLDSWLDAEQRIRDALLTVTETTIVTEFRLDRDFMRRLLPMFPNVRQLRLDTVRTLETLKSLNYYFWLRKLESVQTVRWPGESKAHFQREDLRIFSDDASVICWDNIEPRSRKEQHPFHMGSG